MPLTLMPNCAYFWFASQPAAPSSPDETKTDTPSAAACLRRSRAGVARAALGDFADAVADADDLRRIGRVYEVLDGGEIAEDRARVLAGGEHDSRIGRRRAGPLGVERCFP